MKQLLIVLASGTLAALAVYAVVEWQGLATITLGDAVAMRIRVLIGGMAVLGIGSAALALLLKGAVDRQDRAATAALEQRIARLEARQGTPSDPTS